MRGEVQLHAFLTSALDGGEKPASSSDHLISRKDYFFISLSTQDWNRELLAYEAEMLPLHKEGQDV